MKKVMAILLASLVLVACQGAGDPPIEVNRDDIRKLNQDKNNDGKRFTFVGYPSIKRDVRIGRDKKISVGFTTEPEGKGDFIDSMALSFSSSGAPVRNGAYVPSSFTEDDLRVFDDNKNTLTNKDKVRVTFKMDLDVKRGPHDKNVMEKDERGIPRMVKGPPTYFGGSTSPVLERLGD